MIFLLRDMILNSYSHFLYKRFIYDPPQTRKYIERALNSPRCLRKNCTITTVLSYQSESFSSKLELAPILPWVMEEREQVDFDSHFWFTSHFDRTLRYTKCKPLLARWRMLTSNKHHKTSNFVQPENLSKQNYFYWKSLYAYAHIRATIDCS